MTAEAVGTAGAVGAVGAVGILAFWVLLVWIGVRAVRLRAALSWREPVLMAFPIVVLGLFAAIAARPAVPAGVALWGAIFDGVQTTLFVAVGLHAARELCGDPLPLDRPGRQLGVGLGAGALFAGWTFGVLRLVPVDVGPAAPAGLLVAALVSVRASLAEEALYRLGIQNHLARVLGGRRRGRVIAGLIAAAIWLSPHLATLDPVWLRALQLGPIALALAVLSARSGILACMTAHALLNLALLAPGFLPGFHAAP